MSFYTDHCRTAADVQEAAARNSLFRREAFKPRPEAPKMVEPLEPPAPPPVIVAPVEAPPPPAPESALAPAAEAEWRVPSFITLRAVITAACAHFDIPHAVLISPQRGNGLSWKRQVAFFIASIVTGKSLPEIGRVFGARDHTTILHGVRRIRRLIDAGAPEILAAREAILERLGLPPGYALARRDCIDWTDEEIAILRAGWNVRDVNEMAAELKRSVGGITSKASKLELGPRTDICPTRLRWPLWHERLAQLAADGLSSKQIAIQISDEAKIYVGKGSVLHQLDKVGIRPRKSKLLGEVS